MTDTPSTTNTPAIGDDTDDDNTLLDGDGTTVRYTADGEYLLDGTLCTIGVVRPGGTENCNKPANKSRCEFHYVFTNDSVARAACRGGSTSKSAGGVLPKHMLKYKQLFTRLVVALQNDERRAPTAITLKRVRVK